MKLHNRLSALVAGFFLAAAGSMLGADFPVKVSPTGRFLTDQSGVPFLIQGDSPWSLIIALNHSEVGQYLDDRRAKGFNTILVELVEHLFHGGDNPNPSPINRFGDAPFGQTAGVWDFTKPNEAYFANADYVIDQAAARGIVVVLFPCYVGYPGTQEGWYSEMLTNGTTKCQAYGQYVGNRYKNKPNIIWAMYGDHDTDSTIGPMVEAIAAGIQSADPNHIFTAHLQRDTEVRGALSGGATWLQLSSTYSHSLVYPGCLNAYTIQPLKPFFQIENDYEGENLAPPPATVRAEAYWANLSGACGQMYGNNPVWLFASGWQAALDSVGANDMKRVKALFLSRPWYTLVPDGAHTVLTAGYGSFGDTNYVTAARASDGSTMLAYLPVGGTVTVDLTKISGAQAKAWWYDPRTQAATPIGTFSTAGPQGFTAPTSDDWVLVVDDSSQQFPPPGSLSITTTSLPGVAAGTAYAVQLTATGGTGAYTWSIVSGSLPATIGLSPSGGLSGTPAAGGTYNFTVEVSDGISNPADQPLSLTVTIPGTTPAITVQPQSRTVTAGSGVTFSVTATGVPAPTYQWRKDLVNIGGATNASLSLNNVQPGDAGTYTVVATNATGSATSSDAVLTVVASVSDFNGDGGSDLIWQNNVTGERYVWLMNGAALGSSVPLVTASTQWQIVGAADFNGDGKTDLVWQNTLTGERLIWLMNGTTFSSSISLGIVSTQWQIAGTGDFNADGKPDLVWQNMATGERAIWLMNGTALASNISLGFVGVQWQIAGVGDFNGDGKPDLVWQNAATGQRLIWLMDGTAFSSSVSLGTVSTDLKIAAVGYFNSDVQPDLVWQNSVTGERFVWLMNGTSIASVVSLGTVGVEWTIGQLTPWARTKSDFNGDGRSDLVWQNTTTGERYVWLMNGTALSASVFLGIVPNQWRIAGTGDFNADGKPDLLWQNTTTGDRLIWLMNGTSYASSVSLGTVPTDWQAAGIGDFDNDGKPDIVWQNTTTGLRVIWLMDGTAYRGNVSLGTVPVQWQIVGTGDFNGDGKADLVWQNTATGERAIWLMNGTMYSSEVSLGVVGTQWAIAGVGDFNADGKPDLLWQNTATGERYVWLMNGTVFSSNVFLGVLGTDWLIAN